MKTKVSETIFSGGKWVIPLASVQHIEKDFDTNGGLKQICIITDKTKWNFQCDTYENACWITDSAVASSFLTAFTSYIAERDGMLESLMHDNVITGSEARK